MRRFAVVIGYVKDQIWRIYTTQWDILESRVALLQDMSKVKFDRKITKNFWNMQEKLAFICYFNQNSTGIYEGNYKK